MITPKRSEVNRDPVDSSPWPAEDWSLALKSAVRNSTELLNTVGLEQMRDATEDPFPTLVPRSYIARMTFGDPNDPLLRQVLPTGEERTNPLGFSRDPLAEQADEFGLLKAPGLLQKYRGRVLLITTGGCAINCRYCFRRHFPYAEHRDTHLEQALNAIRHDTSIREVILSGGDPLLLSDSALAQLIDSIDDIAHVKRLRIHTRIPIVLPQRATQGLLGTLSRSRLQTVVVIHCNHRNELDKTTQRSLACFAAAGTRLLNQSVLLRGVNADAQTQIELAEGLFEQGVMPYYLHLPDAVLGTHHFYVDKADGQAIYRAMQAQLPGYLLPRLVQEQAGKTAKTIISA